MKGSCRNGSLETLAIVCLFCLVLYGVSVCATNNSSDGAVLDYCEGQTFIARCPSNDEVILMQSAFYGRMRSGRCLKVTLGTECQVNIRDQFDVWCSGQRSCDVRISSIIDSLPAMPCLRDYRGYLEASYTCVKAVLKRKEECAQRNSVAEVSISGSGFLASIVTEETSCGSTDVPWVLRASPGQQIRLRLYDFAITNRERDQLADQLPRVCQVYAVIKEKPSRGSETICGSDDRESHKYTSVTNQLELRMVAASATQKKNQRKSYYMFQYEVIGCPDLSPSPGQWIARQDLVSTLVCNKTGEKWQLKCEEGEWIGPKKNCTLHDAGESDPTNSNLMWAIFTGSQWAAIAIILGIAITIGLIIFLVGLIYLKKRRPVSFHGGQSGCSSPHCVPSYHLAHCSDPILPTPGSKSLQSTRSTDANYSSAENDYFRTWQLQRQVVPPSCSAASASAAATPSGAGQRFTVLRACPAGGQLAGGGGGGCAAEPGGQCGGGRRVVIEHIYESPKFERRDLSSPEGADTPGQQPGTPLQYHELDPRVARS